MMAPRLVALRNVLKPTGSLYLHCDPTASHYLKLLLDAVFGPQQFINEIAWKRWSAHPDAKRFGAVHDIILFYGKSANFKFNKQLVPYDPEYVRERFKFKDPDGRRWAEQSLVSPNPRPNLTYSYTASNGVTYEPHRRGWSLSREMMEKFDREGRLHFPPKGKRLRRKDYLDDHPGAPLQDVWTDIYGVGGSSGERLGYPTQKPEALLERIIRASSDEGDMVLDPFCGCGTAVATAQALNRRWIGIDITHLAIALVRHRLVTAFDQHISKTFEVIGEPTDLGGAEALRDLDRYQFQWWALGLVGAAPVERKKGADKGIDGQIVFFDDKTKSGHSKRIIISVKSGKLKPDDVRALAGVVEREKGAIGALITLDPPTKKMRADAASAGVYNSPLWNQPYPKIQILTVADLLAGTDRLQSPSLADTGKTFKAAPKTKVGKKELKQTPLFGSPDGHDTDEASHDEEPTDD
jgi:DNA modification methylase